MLGDKNKENQRMNDDLDDDKKSDKGSSSYMGSSMAKNSTALLGYNKINSLVLEQNCKMIKKYLKKIHLDDSFKQNTVIKLFPEDIVKDNVSIFENQEEFQKPTYKFIGIVFKTYIIFFVVKFHK